MNFIYLRFNGKFIETIYDEKGNIIYSTTIGEDLAQHYNNGLKDELRMFMTRLQGSKVKLVFEDYSESVITISKAEIRGEIIYIYEEFKEYKIDQATSILNKLISHNDNNA